MRPTWITCLLTPALLVALGATVIAGHGHHCRKCLPCCCCCSSKAPAAAPAEAPAAPTAPAAQAPLVSSMPMFMPMFAMPMTVMPAAYQSSSQPPAAPAAPANEIRNCCDRVDALERDVKSLAQSVERLEAIMEAQHRILTKLAEPKKVEP